MDKITELRNLIREIYCWVKENNQANIQILKNQRHLLQQHLPVKENKPQNLPANFQKTEDLVEETNIILGMITSGKSKT